MPVNPTLVARFFQLLANKQFTEAERELVRIKQKMHRTEWNHGYFLALNGMLYAQRSSKDHYSFLSNFNITDKNVIDSSKKEFSEHTKNKLHEDFDRGFFSAWTDFMRVLSKLDFAKKLILEEEPPKKLLTLEEDKGQAVIKNFFPDQD